MPKKRFLTAFLLLFFLLLILSLLYLSFGDKQIALSALTESPIVRELRLPRLLSLYLAGFLLSVSGFLVQLMTRNAIPLRSCPPWGFLVGRVWPCPCF